MQVKVSGDVRGVESRDTNGAWVALKLQSWGDWAGSYRIEPGHLVRFRATLADGRVVESCHWTHPTPSERCGTESGTPTTGFAASFRNVRGNAWWVETDVSTTGGTLAGGSTGCDPSASSTGVCGVDARVNGGSWVPLAKQSYGSWAKSMSAPTGSTVELRARAADGSVATSAPFRWPPS